MDVPEGNPPEAVTEKPKEEEQPARAVEAEPPLPVQRVLFGRHGLRAGWRLLIFFLLLFAIGAGVRAVVGAFTHVQARRPSEVSEILPETVVVGEWLSFLEVLLASMIMAGIERRKTGDYGLPARGIFGKRFWEGALLGFGGITLVLAVLRLSGNFFFGSIGLHGVEVWRNAGVYGLLFLGVGFLEEYSFRGYPLFALSDGIGFWPAAIVISAAFGYVHGSNSGETTVGLVSVAVFSLTFCWVLLRTGDLWLAVGFHMTWDWGETYFYGVPDSGLVAPGHLLNPSFHGPAWLTGGTVGPEGSIYTPITLGLVALVVGLRYRGRRYKRSQNCGIGESGD